MKRHSSPSMSYKMFDGLKADGETGNIQGYASSFNVVDEVQEVVVEGAFSNSLKQRGTSRPVLSQHNSMRNPIGMAEVFEDGKGLGFKGMLVTSTADGHDVYELIKAGVLTKMSIGYNVIEDSWKDGVRYLKEIDLREISVVTFPANEDTEVGAVKSIDTIRKLASMKDAELDEETLKELTDEEVLGAEEVIKRIKKERGMDAEEEEEEEEKSEDEPTEEEEQSASDILDLLREEDEDEDEEE